jgi:hypothetical protein
MGAAAASAATTVAAVPFEFEAATVAVPVWAACALMQTAHTGESEWVTMGD